MLVIILGFYLYLAYVEKSLSHDKRFFIIVGLLFLVMIVAGLLIVFTNLLYFLVATLASYKLGLIIHAVLENKFEFFT